MYIVDFRSMETITNEEIKEIFSQVFPKKMIKSLVIEDTTSTYIEVYVNDEYYFMSKTDIDNEIIGNINNQERMKFLNLMLKMEFLKVVFRWRYMYIQKKVVSPVNT